MIILTPPEISQPIEVWRAWLVKLQASPVDEGVDTEIRYALKVIEAKESRSKR